MRALFTWIHLSDVPLDHRDAGHAAGHLMVLAAVQGDMGGVPGGAGLRNAARLVGAFRGDERSDEALADDRGHLVRRHVSEEAS